MVDVAIVGAGINGATVAYRLRNVGISVAVFDYQGVGGGGSGAAGAFLSPKMTKGGELRSLINEALDEALDFYSTNFPKAIDRHPLLHIAKNETDAKNLRYIKAEGTLPLLENPPLKPQNEYIYTSKSAIVEAKTMCERLLDGLVLKREKIDSLEYTGEFWLLNGSYRAKKVVLATGAYSLLVKEKYLKGAVRGIWGHRIGIETATKIPLSLHQFVSIAPTKDGKTSIGATHDVHFNPNSGEPYNYDAGREELLQKASKTIALKEVKIVADFVGLRSGSSDYLPLVGGIVASAESLKRHNKHTIVNRKFSWDALAYHPNLYMINGSAGYGFVLAPLLSRLLCEHIVNGAAIPKMLDPTRFFIRSVKRS